MRVTAIYAGTFDPITNGHSNIIERAATIFEQIIVAVAANPPKNTMFSIEKRIELTTIVLSKLNNIIVRSFESLLVEFAKQCHSTVIIRGLRSVSDFDYELQMAYMNRALESEIETIFLTPTSNNSYISSSLIKEIALLGGTIDKFVHPEVSTAIYQQIN